MSRGLCGLRPHTACDGGYFAAQNTPPKTVIKNTLSLYQTMVGILRISFWNAFFNPN